MQAFIRIAAFFSVAFMVITPALSAPTAVKLSGSMEFLSDAPMEKIVGNASGTGTFNIDVADLTKMTGKVTVPVTTLKTGNDRRDEHLRGDSWLNAAAHPTIEFSLKSATLVGETKTKGPVSMAKVALTGDMTIHGVTKPLTTTATIKWKENKFKIGAKFEIALADYEVKGASGVVGSKVGKSIAISVALKGVGGQ
jgi:polyisoprenoid-binding protein YceI